MSMRPTSGKRLTKSCGFGKYSICLKPELGRVGPNPVLGENRRSTESTAKFRGARVAFVLWRAEIPHLCERAAFHFIARVTAAETDSVHARTRAQHFAGISLLVGATMCFACIDSSAKFMNRTMVPMQTLTVRYL